MLAPLPTRSNSLSIIFPRFPLRLFLSWLIDFGFLLTLRYRFTPPLFIILALPFSFRPPCFLHSFSKLMPTFSPFFLSSRLYSFWSVPFVFFLSSPWIHSLTFFSTSDDRTTPQTSSFHFTLFRMRFVTKALLSCQLRAEDSPPSFPAELPVLLILRLNAFLRV
jgi:hypothetical protein